MSLWIDDKWRLTMTTNDYQCLPMTANYFQCLPCFQPAESKYLLSTVLIIETPLIFRLAQFRTVCLDTLNSSDLGAPCTKLNSTSCGPPPSPSTEDHMGPWFSCTKMYIELDSKRSKSGHERVFRKRHFSHFSSWEKHFPVVKSGFWGHISH